MSAYIDKHYRCTRFELFTSYINQVTEFYDYVWINFSMIGEESKKVK